MQSCTFWANVTPFSIKLIAAADALGGAGGRKATLGLNYGCLSGCPRNPTLCNATCRADGAASHGR